MDTNARRSSGKYIVLFAAALWLASAAFAVGQDMPMPGLESTGMDHGAAPVSDFGGVSFFSQDLGTILRLRYNTESYGQDDHGNFDIGTMQVLSLDDAIAFFDGQVTMNDVQGVGYNIGAGVRWMSYPPYSLDTGRIDGVSIWADGTHTEAGNFFPQVGLSYESLGELWDFRLNGYAPLGPQDKTGEFVATDAMDFQGNSLSQVTEAVVDSSFYLAELEVARRLGAHRDAWAFSGPYYLANDDDDSAGYRAGLRGYAYPDLLLQIAVSNDEVFDTNATFSVVWFVGRTRTDYQPACGVPDRFREPVMRNDYVVLDQGTATGGIPLTQPDGSALRFVHVDSSAAAGGDGTFENPYSMLSSINGTGSRNGDIILAHAQSNFNGDTSSLLKNNQRLLGEGDGFTHMVTTAEEGTIVIPETAPGARDAARPMIVAAMGDAIRLADANEMGNFDIDGQNITARAIASPSGGSGNPNIHDLTISNIVSDAIALTPLEVTDINDADGDGNTTETLVRGSVTINEVEFNNIGGDDIDINSATTVNVATANVLQEQISITNVTSTNGNGRGIDIRNTHSGANRTTTLTDYTYNGGTTSDGAIRLTNFDGAFTASNSTLTNGAASGQGVAIEGDTDGTITFQSSVMFNNLDGTAFVIDGDSQGNNQFGGTVVVNSDIQNDTGLSFFLRGLGAGSATFNGDVTDTGLGIRALDSGGGLILFTGDLALNTGGSTAIRLDNNTGTDIDFTGQVDITTTSGSGFVATDGGSVSVTNTGNSINTGSGQAALIRGMEIAPLGVTFNEVNRSVAAATSALQVENNTGGPILFGDITAANPGDSGTLQGGAADTVVIRNSANTTVSGLIVNNAANQSGVLVDKTTNAAMTVNLNDLQINGGNLGVEVDGNGTSGNLTMSVNDTDILGSTAFGMQFDNVDNGNVAVNGATIDGNNANAAAQGVQIVNSNATFSFDSTTTIREFGSTDFEVSGGTGTISYSGNIVNSTTANPGDTTGRSVHVHDVTGGSVTFTPSSSINDDNLGMLIANNGTAAISLLGTNTLNTTGTAVTISDNDQGGTNANVTLAGLNITTTGTGAGLVATGGGTLSVTGANNRINTDNGAALRITDMTIGNVDFATVTADGATGPATAIELRNLIGGQVAIGPAAGAFGDGGVLRTTDDAIVLENVQNVDLRRIQIINAGDAAGEHGVEIMHTNTATTTMDVTLDALDINSAFGNAINVAGANNANLFNLRLTDSDLEDRVAMGITGSGGFQLLVDNNDINTTGTDIAFSLAFSGSVQDADVTIRNDNRFTAANAKAFELTVNGTNADVEFRLDNNVFTNASATQETADVLANGGATLNANVVNNTFTNSGAADEFEMTSDGSNTRIDLNLNNNTASGGGMYHLETANNGGGFNFGVVNRDATNGNNTGTVMFDPNINDFESISGPVEEPSLP